MFIYANVRAHLFVSWSATRITMHQIEVDRLNELICLVFGKRSQTINWMREEKEIIPKTRNVSVLYHEMEIIDFFRSPFFSNQSKSNDDDDENSNKQTEIEL